MSKLQLSFAIGSPARFKPILDGAVQPEGIDLISSAINPGQLFWRLPRFNDFDVAELSLTGYLWGVQHGMPWIALPVFPGWVFSCHTETLVREDSGIDAPEDLRGKRVGVPEYPVTAIVWARHAFDAEYGVRPQDVHWFEERTNVSSHYRMMGYRPPADVRVETIPEEQFLCDMFLAGQLDALVRYFGRRENAHAPVPTDRSHIPLMELAERPGVRWLFTDPKAAGLAYQRKIGHLQPIHCIVMRRELAERHPWAPLSLYQAFVRSAEITSDADYVRPPNYALSKEEQIEAIGPDFFPAGLNRNRGALEHFLELAQWDGYLPRSEVPNVERLFHPSTLHT